MRRIARTSTKRPQFRLIPRSQIAPDPAVVQPEDLPAVVIAEPPPMESPPILMVVPQSSPAPRAVEQDADDMRAARLADRVAEGLSTLDRARRRRVFLRIAERYCTLCGNDDPACPCGVGR